MILLETQALHIRQNKKILCAGLNLTLKTQEVWGILGANGCGKTTLLHSLAGLFTEIEGKVLLKGKTLASYPLKTLATHIGILFQETTVPFPQTIWEYCLAARFPHLTYFKKESKKDLDVTRNALMQMELSDLSQKKLTELSGGEKRRAALAALLTQSPDIYLLDEPTNHLDLRHQINVLTYFKKLAKENQKIVVMSLHDINLAAAFCDHLLFCFPYGNILQGETASLLTKKNLSELYQCEMNAYTKDGSLFWHPL